MQTHCEDDAEVLEDAVDLEDSEDYEDHEDHADNEDHEDCEEWQRGFEHLYDEWIASSQAWRP